MRSAASTSLFARIFNSRQTAFGVCLAITIAVCGCTEPTPDPPTPDPPTPLVEDIQTGDQKGVVDAPTDHKTEPVPVPSSGDHVVPTVQKFDFSGMSANEKLDQIAEVIRSSWGDGNGFVYVPETAGSESSEDQLVLTLRWQSVEKQIAPLLQQAFGITGRLVCRFSSPGEFECNHPVYQLAILRAQNRPHEFVSIHQRVDATLPSKAPILREQFLQHDGRQTEFYEAIRTSLTTMALPAQLQFSGDEGDSFADDHQCVIFTKWTTLPAEFEKSTEADSFEWRLKLVIREAVDKLEAEWENLQSEKNRLELVSFAEFRRGQNEPFEPAGPLNVTAMGFDSDTSVQRYQKRFIARMATAEEVLTSPENYPTTGPYPNPATFVGGSKPVETLVSSVHQAIQQHLTESVAE